MERPFRTLSGGNQQKVLLAKWLRRKPRVLLLTEPTQGVDVGARATIHRLIADAAKEGTAVLMASTDTTELALTCDRVLVMRDGRVVAELSGGALTSDRITGASLVASMPTGAR
jgi:ribose transport system ATP-binding protein